MRRREKEKLRWKRLQKLFGKTRMKLILAVKYKVNSTIVRTTLQLKMEEAIMLENSTYFSLAYSSPVFTTKIIERIGRLANSKEVNDLIHKNVDLVTSNNDINLFLRLMYQSNPFPINTHVSIDRWNSY